MLLGLVTDVHNHAAELSAACDYFQSRDVDQILTIGDTCDIFGSSAGAQEVARLLIQHHVIGVWGNHDYPFCWDIEADTRERYPEIVFQAMGAMKPRWTIEEYHFSHKESSIDPYDVSQLWEISDQPCDLIELSRRAFAATHQRCQFIGHYHRWWVATSSGSRNWAGDSVLVLDSSIRYFVVVAPLFEGWCCLLDTTQGILEPHRL